MRSVAGWPWATACCASWNFCSARAAASGVVDTCGGADLCSNRINTMRTQAYTVQRTIRKINTRVLILDERGSTTELKTGGLAIFGMTQLLTLLPQRLDVPYRL